MSPANTNTTDRPKTFREWVLWRIQRSPSRTLLAARAELPPKYLGVESLLDKAELPLPDVERYVRAELTAMRNEGLIAAHSGRWYARPRKLKCKKRA